MERQVFSVEQFLNEMKAAIDARSEGASWVVLLDDKHVYVTMQQNGNNYKFDIEGCITFSYIPSSWEDGEDEIHLDYYYFNSGCRGNLLMSHKTFFAFLDMVGKKLEVAELNLVDASSKDLKWCNLPVHIFALAGDPTFYERYGFANPQFAAHIQRIRMLPLSEFVLLQKRQSVFYRRNWKSFKQIHMKSKRTRAASTLLRQYAPYTEETPVWVVARFIVDTCKRAFMSKTPEGVDHDIDDPDIDDLLPRSLAVDVQNANRLFNLLMRSYPKDESGYSVKRLRGGRSKRVRPNKH